MTNANQRVSFRLRGVANVLQLLVNESTHERRQRAGQCATALVGFDFNTGVATFRTRCKGSGNVWEQKIGFETAGGGWDRVLNLVYETTEPEESRSFTDFLNDFKARGLDPKHLSAKVICSCPDFNYQGYAYLLYNSGVGFVPSGEANQPPAVKNPQGTKGLCKHLIAVINRYYNPRK